MHLAVFVVLAQIAIPAPRGYVNDFAGVLDSGSVAHMEAVIAQVRAATRGEIAVVTLPPAMIGDRAASDMAVQIGRQWGVGAKGEAGDAAKNLGVVVLLMPLQDHRRGTGQIFIATGRGAEGFLPDARVGRIRDAMTPYLSGEDYGAGLAVGVDLIAQAFADEFGFALTGVEARPPPPEGGSDEFPIPVGWVVAIIILLIIVTRGRILLVPFALGRFGGRGGGRWGGGGGGGGFGGFGGGGGFSGGGAGGRF